MKVHRNISTRKILEKERPDYYITPTRDFTKYTKDCAEKYWSKETAFDWNQSVPDNLRQHLESLNPEELSKIAFMTLPMVEETVKRKILQIREQQLPDEEDALKDISECLPFDRTAILEALQLRSPLKSLELSVSKLKDQLEILQGEALDLREQQRLGLYRKGVMVKQLETTAEQERQNLEFSALTVQIIQVEKEFKQHMALYEIETIQLKTQNSDKLSSIECQVLVDLEETQKLLQRTLQSGNFPKDEIDLSKLIDLIFKRQIRGLKDIANHALVVEQSAIAPLTMGIIHYKRHREIQEAMTTFINDEAKHSATFRRYLAEKLEAREFISAKLIKGANRYMWLARFLPGTGMFLAVIVEAIGAASLEFFSKKEYMPDSLFRSICKIITDQDETRHLDLCVDMYNELFRKGRRWEVFRNNLVLMVMMKSVYGDKTEDHRLIQAFRAFGVESDSLYSYVTNRVSQQLSRISMYVEPEKLLRFMGRR